MCIDVDIYIFDRRVLHLVIRQFEYGRTGGLAGKQAHFLLHAKLVGGMRWPLFRMLEEAW